jgi:hypothetical protein
MITDGEIKFKRGRAKGRIMRENDRVRVRREIKITIDGETIPEGTEGVIIAKITGSGKNTFEVDFGEYGTVFCDKYDLDVIRE